MTNRTKVLFLFFGYAGRDKLPDIRPTENLKRFRPKNSSIETNAMDWLLLLPNAKVEFDLSNSTDRPVGDGA